MCVCKGCGRSMQSDYLYCPWCGFSRVSRQEETLDVLFNKYEQFQKVSRRKQLQDMKMELQSLEEELAVLALSSEMAK